MKGTLITIGIILLVLGLIGFYTSWSMAWDWILVILGIIGIIWGWASKGKGTV